MGIEEVSTENTFASQQSTGTGQRYLLNARAKQGAINCAKKILKRRDYNSKRHVSSSCRNK